MRAPASANALLSVRVTTTFGWSATSFSALSPPNSM